VEKGFSAKKTRRKGGKQEDEGMNAKEADRRKEEKELFF